MAFGKVVDGIMDNNPFDDMYENPADPGVGMRVSPWGQQGSGIEGYLGPLNSYIKEKINVFIS